ncbi:hypothetical protein FCV25MIE_29275 [Fagus crenata]
MGSILYHKRLTNPSTLFLPSFPIPSPSTNHLFSSSLHLHLHRPSLLFHSNQHSSRPLRPCHAVNPGPPPDSDPPPQNDPVHLTGPVASLSKFQDRVQIFLAVLFWMSLFFWASAWDGRNRPNKGSPFRR